MQYTISMMIRSMLSHLQQKHGISILLTLTIIFFMISFMSDLMITSQVTQKMSIHMQERVRAEYLAKSGEKLALFVVSIATGVEEAMSQASGSEQESTSVGLGDYAFALNGIPIGGEEDTESFEMLMDMFSLTDVMDSQVIRALKSFPGSFTIYTEDESARINLSYLQNKRLGRNAIAIFEKLLSCPAELRYLDEYKSLSSEELAYRVFDFIDKNSRASVKSGVTTEISPYSQLSPTFSLPNHIPVSVDEIRLVAGWDYDVHALFSKYITVFPWVETGGNDENRGREPLLNLNTASRELLQCLFSEMIESDDDYRNFVKRFSKVREDGEKWVMSNEEIADTLAKEFGYRPPEVASLSVGNDRTQWFTSGTSTYRLISQGRSGETTLTLVSVVNMQGKLLKDTMLYWSMKLKPFRDVGALQLQ